MGSYYRLSDKPEEGFNYYKMYRSEDPQYGTLIYVSSTLIDYYRPSIDLKWELVPNGTFEKIKATIENGGISVTRKVFSLIK